MGPMWLMLLVSPTRVRANLVRCAISRETQMTTTDGAASGESPMSTSRRNAIKLAVGGGAAAIVWAEPTLKGLARRPAYATTGSTEITALSTDSIDSPGLSAQVTVTANDGTELAIVFGVGDFGTAFLSVTNLAEPTCDCVIASVVSSTVVTSNGDVFQGQLAFGVIEFGPLSTQVVSVAWDQLEIVCAPG